MKSIGIALLSLMFLWACDSGKKEESASTDKKEDKPVVLETTQTKAGDPVITAYLTLKEQLVASDMKQAKKAAKDLALAANADTTDVLREAIHTQAAAMVESSELEDMRKTFYSLSEVTYKWAMQNVADSEELYWQYCPMAFDNKGAYWLSNSEKIRNPYFGDKMLECGKVKEEI